MKADIRLIYGRLGQNYHGSINVRQEGLEGFISEMDFQDFPFARMMSHLARTIRGYQPGGSVVLVRSELKGSDYPLDAATIELLRVDPPAAIRSMTHENISVVVRDKLPSSVPPGLLRAGHNTIADSLGDRIYISMDLEGRFECIGCGRWSRGAPDVMTCTMDHCSVQLRGQLHGKTWYSVPTKDVLSLNLVRYYIPRSWNPTRSWISHADLNKMYKTFQEERDKCYQVEISDPKG